MATASTIVDLPVDDVAGHVPGRQGTSLAPAWNLVASSNVALPVPRLIEVQLVE
jgi:hypothetical protein